MLFDTHTHLNVEQFEEDEKEVIQRAKDHGVSKMAVVGFDHPTIKKSLELSKSNEGIYSIVGWHPTEAGSYSDEIEEMLTDLVENEEIIALGEMGLDYHWMDDPKEVQIESFRKQIRLAKKLQLPIVIHNRESTKDVYRVLKEENIKDIGGIMHSFNLSPDWLSKFLDLGMHISFSGVVTFKNAAKVKESAKRVPLDKILIETDAPYLSPEPNRGKRNEPSYVRFVAEELAELLELPVEKIAEITSENAMKLFKIEEN
ncbi:MAG: TatD family hydrolase [Atopostipes suicloacalis]|nr:TatD family hydrolase [Atopostipes suicloacalis]MDN6730807.1 TatD family hydrolase [Atopostipes suicloacalis]